MKLLGLFIFISSLFYGGKKHCNNLNSPAAVPYDTVIKKEPITWIEDFKLFRNAVFQNDKATVKQYFKFPLYNEGNEIWMLVLKESEYEKAAGKKKLAFQEKDLDKYYSKIFPQSFKKSILKVKTDELFKTGRTETAEMKEGETTYRMIVDYDKKLRTLSLNLAYNTVFKDEKGEVLDGGESNVIYHFIVDKAGHIIFKEVRLAG